jgi:thermitase
VRNFKQTIKNNPILFILIGVFGVLFGATYVSYISHSHTTKHDFSQSPTTKPTITSTPQLIPGKDYAPGHVTVKFKTSVTPTEIRAAIAEHNAKIINQIPSIGVTVLEVAPGQEQIVIDALTKEGLVDYAELDVLREDNAFTPNDTDFSQQYSLKIVKAPEAWDITKGKGVVIANIQNGGADTTHPDLKPNILSGNGNIEHGTHTSGIIAAATNNSLGVAGTCPECKLMIQNINGYTATNIAKAITTSADGGAKVISMSFGGTTVSQAEKDAIAYAWGKGSVLVASAGNDATSAVEYPAGVANVVAVAATDASDKMASYSNFGTWVKIAAPGDKIISTLPGGKYGLMSGTSMAAPMMSGIFGLIWSTSYGTSPTAVVKRACDTADKITGTGTKWQCGRVNVFAAVSGSTTTPSTAPAQPTTAPIQPSTPPTSLITPSFFPLAPCPTCVSQNVQATVTPEQVMPSDNPSTDPNLNDPNPNEVMTPDISATPQLPQIGNGHAGQSGGLFGILIALIMLILQFFAGMFGN